MRAPTGKTQTLNDNSFASDPGLVRLSRAKLRRFHPELYLPWSLIIWSFGKSYWRTHVEEHLHYGDSRAAVVMQTSPLLIAAYTDEIDCIALLNFSDKLVGEYTLSPGSRLLTVNTYAEIVPGQGIAQDLTAGAGDYGRYGNFAPFIAEFLSDDLERIATRKAEIDEVEWQRTQLLGQEYINRHGPLARDGRPLNCMYPARR